MMPQARRSLLIGDRDQARATVNRLWKHFLGCGLVELIDALAMDNPSTHPRVLDLLAAGLFAANFKSRLQCSEYCNTIRSLCIIELNSRELPARKTARRL